MGRGEFKKPPEGPKIGPTVNYTELPEDRKREIGDLAKAAEESIFKPAPLDSRVAQAEEKTAAPEPETTSSFDVGAADPTAEERNREAAERLDALQAALEKESEQTAEEDLRTSAAPTEEDKQEFLRCILGSRRRYRKSYPLFGGVISVVFTDLTPRDEEEIFAELGKAHAAGAVITEDDWSLMFDRLRMMHSIVEFSRSGEDVYTRDPDAPDNDRITYDQVDAYIARYGSATIYRAVLQASRLFRTHMDIILERATDSDFWTGVGQDLQSPPTSDAR
jgi:hypothetical protein